MIEVFTKGLVLDKEIDDKDGLFTIFTETLGKVRGRATSSRKITSKLAAHLEPGCFSAIRLVQKTSGNGFRVIDALIEKKMLLSETPEILFLADKMTAPGQPDQRMFACLKKLAAAGEISSGWKREILTIAGFDPAGASCDLCGSESFAYFSSRDIMFLCEQCLKRNPDCREGLIRL
jgi:DNA repair protein RecO